MLAVAGAALGAVEEAKLQLSLAATLRRDFLEVPNRFEADIPGLSKPCGGRDELAAGGH